MELFGADDLMRELKSLLKGRMRQRGYPRISLSTARSFRPVPQNSFNPAPEKGSHNAPDSKPRDPDRHPHPR
jgi:hypothetical protein